MVVSWNVLESLVEKYPIKQVHWKGGMQPGVEPDDEPGVEPNASSFPISKILNMVPITPNSIASPVSQSDKLIHVSFIHFNGL